MNEAAQSAPRAIIHIDMDAFYASVEQRDCPSLKGQAVIVAGLGRRGVVTTASYEARRFGVRSAMPTATARRLCPDGVYMAPRMSRYAEVSAEVFAVFGTVTPEIEGLSLDEAFLDVSASRSLLGDIETIGRQIKHGVESRTGLVCSVGMAHNKLLAKLACELGKPNGFFHLLPDRVRETLDPLPVSKLWTVGRVAEAKLLAAGIQTIGDLRRASPERLRELVGNHAKTLQLLAQGLDERPVESGRDDKSLGAETTFEHDLTELDDARAWLMRLTERVGERARRHGVSARTVTLKLRVPPFETMTRQLTLGDASAATDTLYVAAESLLSLWWSQRRRPRLRLLGISLSGLNNQPATQGGLFESADLARRDGLLDQINQRFGGGSIRRATGLKAKDD